MILSAHCAPPRPGTPFGSPGARFGPGDTPSL